MSIPRPHFLLLCDGSLSENKHTKVGMAKRGRWRFVLESLDRAQRLEVTDVERVNTSDRLALIAIVRGLEALEQPSDVTLVTTSRYVWRGLETGLAEWRERGYCWEHFGILQPIRNQDLWHRIDKALQYHTLHCRLMCPMETDAALESEQGELSAVGTVSMAMEPIPAAEETALEAIPEPPKSNTFESGTASHSDQCELEMIPVAPNRWRRIDAPHDSRGKKTVRREGEHLPFHGGSRKKIFPAVQGSTIGRNATMRRILKALWNTRLLRDIAFGIMGALGLHHLKRSFS